MLGHSSALRVDSNAIGLGLSRSHLLGPSNLLRQDAGNSLPVLKNSFAVSKHAEVAKRMKQFIVPEQDTPPCLRVSPSSLAGASRIAAGN